MASPLIALLVFAIWLGFVLYMLQLATRLVHAVEHIAKRMDPPPGTELGGRQPTGLEGH